MINWSKVFKFISLLGTFLIWFDCPVSCSHFTQISGIIRDFSHTQLRSPACPLRCHFRAFMRSSATGCIVASPRNRQFRTFWHWLHQVHKQQNTQNNIPKNQKACFCWNLRFLIYTTSFQKKKKNNQHICSLTSPPNPSPWGFKKRMLEFNVDGVAAQMSSQVVASISMVLPTMFGSVPGVTPQDVTWRMAKGLGKEPRKQQNCGRNCGSCFGSIFQVTCTKSWGSAFVQSLRVFPGLSLRLLHLFSFEDA